MTGPLQVVLGTISVLFLIVASVMFYRAVRAMVRIIRTGQPDGTRLRPGQDPGEDAAGRVAGPHPDAQVVDDRRRPLVRLHRLLRPVPHPGRGLRRGVEPGVPPADHRRVLPLEPVRRHHRHRHDPRDPLPDLPAPEGPPAVRQGREEPVRRVERGPRLLRRGRRPHRRHLHPADPRAEDLQRPDRHPGLVAPDLRRAGDRASRQPRPAHRRRVRQDRRLADLARGDQPDPEHGRRLAPVQRLLQHLLQAQRGRRRRARPAAADDQRRQADRLRGSGRGRHLRPRQDRGLHLEGDAGLHHLHRVRAVPEPVPGLEHRQAAQPEDADHGPAGPPVRQGPVPARRADRERDRPRLRRPAAQRRAGLGVRLRPHRGHQRRPGAPPAGRHPRGGRGHRPRRPVELHQLRRLRRAVPGRHRARRPHPRHAPLPDADRVELPLRGRRDAAQPGEPRQPVGRGRQRPRGVDQGARLRGPHGRRPDPLRGRVPVLGRLRRRHRRPRQEGHQGRRRAHAHRRRRVRRPRLGRDLLGRPGPPHGQRVRLPAAGHGERRDAQRRLRGPRAGHPQDRRDLPALLQLTRPGVPAGRRRVRGHPPHAAAQPAGRGGPAHPGHARSTAR